MSKIRGQGPIFRERTSTTQADADAWLAGLRSANRYVEDIWGG